MFLPVALGFFGERDQHHVHGASFRSRLLLDFCDIRNVYHDPFQDPQSSVLMHNFASAEKDGNLASVSSGKKSSDVLQLGLVIVLVSLGPDLDFLDLDLTLFFTGRLLLLLLLILVLAVIHDTADRRFGSWRNLNQIQPFILRSFKSVIGVENTKLSTFFVDNPNFSHSDLTITPGMRDRSYSSFLRV